MRFPSVFLPLLLAACGPRASSELAQRQSAESAAGAIGNAFASAAPAAEAKSASREAGARADTGARRMLDVPAVIRALYVNRWAAQSPKRMRELIAIADSTEINGLVIDMKDEFGLNFASADPALRKNAGNSGKVRDLPALLDTLKAHRIVPIARIVVFKDSVTARVHPEWTIRRPDGSQWRDKKGVTWVNPYHRELWDYNIRVAEELARLGFEEIQFDYIRFPEPYRSLPPQVFPGQNGLSKQDALAQYLALARQRLNALGVRSTADIFGLVTTVPGALEVGQAWEKVAPATDVLLPMVYPSHYPHGSFGLARPNAEPYQVIKVAITSAHERDDKLAITAPEHVRPWLQAFTLGAPAYGPEQLQAEKQATYDAGYDGWVMWNPGSRYEAFLPALEKTLESRKKAWTAGAHPEVDAVKGK